MHISQRLALAKGRAVRLKRFTKLKAKNKCHLYKALIRSAMEYPNNPLCNMPITNKNKWQKFQNRTIRKLIKEEGDEDSIEELHVKYKLEAVNTRMYRRAVATWEKFADLESELAEKSMEENRNQD